METTYRIAAITSQYRMGSSVSPPILVLAIAKKPVGTFTATVCIHCWVTLRQIFIMPSVTIKAGSLLRAISVPLTAPMTQPTSTAARMPMRYAGTPVMPTAVSRPAG